MDNKTKSTKKKIIVLVCFLIAATAVALLTAHVYRKSKDEYNKVEPITVKEQSPDDYVRLNNGISKEMMSPDYWTQLRISEGADPAKERLSLGEIERFNSINRRMIVTNTTSFSLKEIDEVFYFKVAKSLVKDVMLTVTNPEDYFVDGVPTDRAFWDDLTLNANVDAITERINVKFGVSVSRTILKRYPTDKRAFEKDSSFYYDELAQSDLLPFIPVAVLHESADSEWYYVLTYGYGGWIRKEHIALCESKEEWISRFEPEDFLVVTGRELRIPTDPYTDSLSDISVPMGTKLPVVSIEDAPEDIHGRISFGNYVAKVPFRNEDGMAEDTYVLIPMTEDVSLGYLPYTEENVAKLAFKHLGAGYGWAGDNNGQDCSGYTREIYACFGYVFPRATVAQVGMECSGSYDVSDKGYKEKMEILENAPIGTLLYFPGHIMIYLDNEEGRPYCISSVGNFATCDMDVGEISEVNTVIITDMIDTTRADGKSWLESVTQIVIP